MENNYLVLEMEDVQEALTQSELEILFELVEKVADYREEIGEEFNNYEVKIKK
jgi:hypothetical protein